jgi:hypothetical protein
VIPVRATGCLSGRPARDGMIEGLSGRMDLAANGDQEWWPDRDGKRLAAEHARLDEGRSDARQQTYA